MPSGTVAVVGEQQTDLGAGADAVAGGGPERSLRFVNIIEIAPVSLVTLVTSLPTGISWS